MDYSTVLPPHIARILKDMGYLGFDNAAQAACVLLLDSESLSHWDFTPSPQDDINTLCWWVIAEQGKAGASITCVTVETTHL